MAARNRIPSSDTAGSIPRASNSPGEEDDSRLSGAHSSQLSFDTNSRSRNDSDASEGDGRGGCFFADMTLDLSEAQMETTPRTDMRFAALARGQGDREDLVRSVPPMPLIEEPAGTTAASAAEGGAGGFPDGDDELDAPISEVQERPLARIESGEYGAHSGVGNGSARTPGRMISHSLPRPSRPPRRPRDVSWTAAALLVVPAGLLLPHLYYPNGYVERHNRHAGHVHHPSWSQVALSHAAHSTILFSLIIAAAAGLGLLRALYSHPGGGEGDDGRHFNITRTFLLASGLTVWLNPLLMASIWLALPKVRWAVALPLGMLVRDAVRMRGGGGGRDAIRTGGGYADGSSSHDRRTFFRALAVAALDILSRSLRRKSLVRVASLLIMLQLLVALLWWGSLSAILSVRVFDEDSVVTKFMHFLWLTLSLLAGWWAMGIVARLLGFVASGGVASWFARQSVMIEATEEGERQLREEEEARRRQRQLQQQQRTSPSSGKTLEPSPEQGEDAATEDSSSNADSGISDDPASQYADGHEAARAALHAMPEAYRSADAAAYSTLVDFDEGLDDDYEEDNADVDGMGRPGGMTGFSSDSQQQAPSQSTVKSFLTAGCTVSLGSIAQCALLGGPAQLLWAMARGADAAGSLLQRHRRRGRPTRGGFRGMDVGGLGGAAGARGWGAVARRWSRLDSAIRGFVRGHSDLAMSHVAAYFKAYGRAANDVAVLIETSGVEPIVHDDITTHMCSSVCHLAAGSVALAFGLTLAAHRSAIGSGDPDGRLSDAALLETLLGSYVLCHGVLFAALEPLRAAVKALYVCFAEHPLSLSRAFPLIYQRLSRISEARR